ncbi:MAG: Bacterial Ig-like domain [Solirubrobacteraceae bacterium]|nr:Bacterial Ig-like domain [Solirubrobacteraceae bacterium]
MRRALAGFAVVAVFWSADVAHGAGLAGPPDPTALRKAGISVTWPVKAASVTFPSYAAVLVSVTPLRLSPPPLPVAHITLRRLSTKTGRPLRTVGTSYLTRGLFRAALARHPSTPYELRLDVGRLHYRSYLQTPPSTSTAVVSTPVGGSCPKAASASSATPGLILRLDRDYAEPGDTLSAILNNQTPACLTVGYSYSIEQRLPDGSWVPTTTSDLSVPPTIALPLLPYGSFASPARVPHDLSPGHYRVSKDALASSPGSGSKASAEFDVYPRGAIIPTQTAAVPSGATAAR